MYFLDWYLSSSDSLTLRHQSAGELVYTKRKRNDLVKTTHLGSQVEAEVAAARQVVLDKQRHLARQANLDLAGQTSSLAKVDEVLERESQRDGLRQLNVDVEVRLLDVGVAAQRDGAVANVTVARELDAVLGSLDADRFGHGRQVGADAAELGRRHGDGGGVLGLGNAQVLLVNVHELEVVLADAVVLAALKDNVEHVGRVLGLERQDVFVLRRAQHLGQRRQVDAQRNVAVAAEGGEALGLEHHGHQRDVRVVHGLQRDARVIAVKVAVLDEVLDGIDDLLCVRG